MLPSIRAAYDYLVEINEQINLTQVQIVWYLCINFVCTIENDAYNDHLWRSSCAMEQRERKEKDDAVQDATLDEKRYWRKHETKVKEKSTSGRSASTRGVSTIISSIDWWNRMIFFSFFSSFSPLLSVSEEDLITCVTKCIQWNREWMTWYCINECIHQTDCSVQHYSTRCYSACVSSIKCSPSMNSLLSLAACLSPPLFVSALLSLSLFHHILVSLCLRLTNVKTFC